MARPDDRLDAFRACTLSAWVQAQKTVHLILVGPRPDELLAIHLIGRDIHLNAQDHHTGPRLSATAAAAIILSDDDPQWRGI